MLNMQTIQQKVAVTLTLRRKKCATNREEGLRTIIKRGNKESSRIRIENFALITKTKIE